MPVVKVWKARHETVLADARHEVEKWFWALPKQSKVILSLVAEYQGDVVAAIAHQVGQENITQARFEELARQYDEDNMLEVAVVLWPVLFSTYVIGLARTRLGLS
jgi:hypothetical protein